MSFTPFQAPLLAPLLGDARAASLFSVRADLDAMLAFEVALARAESTCGVIDPEAASAIERAADVFQPDVAAIGAGVERDGVAIPEFVRQLKLHVGAPHGRHVHYGSTSQDVVDTSLILRLRALIGLYREDLERLIAGLEGLRLRFGATMMPGRTRMQLAVRISAADRITAWLSPLERALERLADFEPRLLVLQFGGPAGNLHVLGERGPKVAEALARELGLGRPEGQWQAQRDRIAEFAAWISLTAGSLGKFGQDIALMAQNEIAEIGLTGGGGSSAMPHKPNPVKAEVLVSLARFEATLLAGTHQSLIHEQERSGAAWTLEWLLLPQMCVGLGAALRLAGNLTGSIERIGPSPERLTS
ncbi:MAG: 3-carboxy-cis,cis-muconate cycloisomerase [Pseudomonadota bacterium]|nr:3-carboxy-cis,cis-muconate cycloisomerase [Pseudomonadota bacterium]